MLANNRDGAYNKLLAATHFSILFVCTNHRLTIMVLILRVDGTLHTIENVIGVRICDLDGKEYEGDESLRSLR